MKKISRFQKSLIVIAVIAIAIPSSLFIFNSDRLLVTPFEVINSELPIEFDGYKIIQISDLHNHDNDYANGNLVEMMLLQQPNAIMFTGDIIDEYTNDLENLEEIFSSLSSIPIYYSNGNHDIHSSLYENFISMIESYGVIDVSDEVAYFSQGAARMAIFGLAEQALTMSYGMLNDQSEAAISVDSLIEGISDYSIFLSHHPDLYQEVESFGIDLMLSGHFHGGHIRLFDWSPLNWVDVRFGGGQFTSNGMDQIISKGTGSGVFPIRINCDSEIVIITLKTN
jgi:predicted MPP superfamily phosphohydrolase